MPTRKALSGLAVGRQRNMSLRLAEPRRPARPPGRGVAETFRKNASRASRVGATETPGLDPNFEAPPMPGQVRQGPLIAIVNFPGNVIAKRAQSRLGARPGDERDPVGAGQDLAHDQFVWNERERESAGTDYGSVETSRNRRLSPIRPIRTRPKSGDSSHHQKCGRTPFRRRLTAQSRYRLAQSQDLAVQRGHQKQRTRHFRW